MKIYTKTGDKGETSLYGGQRVSKADLRVEAYGTVDELNAFVGVALGQVQEEKVRTALQKVQFDLFTLGSEVATPADQLVLANGKNRLPVTISTNDILAIETWIDTLEEGVPPLQYFILPAGGAGASALHVCRTVCRRAERSLVALQGEDALRAELVQYLNRLSDYFFVAARFVTHQLGEAETYWNPAAR